MSNVRTPFGSRRARGLVALVMAAACLATLSIARPAAASLWTTPDYRLTNAIGNQLSYLSIYERGLYDANFARIVNDDTGIRGPDYTRDAQGRQGAIGEYRGWNDRGVMIAHFRYDDGTATATWIYGAILASWEQSGGHDGQFGWPLGTEHTAGDYALIRGCQPGDRAQTFEAATTTAVACWNPWSGVTWHRFWR